MYVEDLGLSKPITPVGFDLPEFNKIHTSIATLGLFKTYSTFRRRPKFLQDTPETPARPSRTWGAHSQSLNPQPRKLEYTSSTTFPDNLKFQNTRPQSPIISTARRIGPEIQRLFSLQGLGLSVSKVSSPASSRTK